MNSHNFSNLVQNFNSIPAVVKTWVMVGSISGAFLAGCHKISEIYGEPSAEYIYPLLERPMRGVYHMTRIVGHAGWGAFIAGLCALTAPLSIPIYIMWFKKPDVTPTNA